MELPCTGHGILDDHAWIAMDKGRERGELERSAPPGTAVAVVIDAATEVPKWCATGRKVSRGAARPIPVASAPSPAPKIKKPLPACRSASPPTTQRDCRRRHHTRGLNHLNRHMQAAQRCF